MQSENSNVYKCRSSCPRRCRRRRRRFDWFILIFFLTATMDWYLSTQSPPTSNNVIFAPKSFNLKADKLKTFNKFKLYRKQYIWYKALTKALKYTKQQSLYIWK